MAAEWDVIIIGAGVGGLTAAAALVKAGLRVLVLERNPHPGGTAYVFRRKGFAFPMGPLGFSNPALISGILSDLGEKDDLDLLRVHYRIKAFDLDIPLSLPFPDMVRTLSILFPSESQSLRRFFNDMEEIVAFQRGSPIRMSRLSKPGEISASNYLRDLFRDQRLCNILGSLGTKEPYSNLSLLAAMWNLMCKEGIWTPKKGMDSFCERLAKAATNQPGQKTPGEIRTIKQGAGEIRLGTGVAKIRVKKERAVGVTCGDGREIDSDRVISNADFKKTFIGLLGPDVLPRQWYHAVANARQTGSVFQVCLGLNSRNADLSVFNEAKRLIFRKNPGQREKNIDWKTAEIDPESLSSQEIEVSLWSHEQGDLPFDEKTVVVIRTEADYAHFAKCLSGSRARTPFYREYKTRLAHALIQKTSPLIPGLEDAISVIDIATPLTFEDQGGRSEGAVAGWSWDYDDFRDSRPRELVRTPIRGLYMTGYQAFSSLFLGGVPAAMESGRHAADAVLQGSDPAEEIEIPGVIRK